MTQIIAQTLDIPNPSGLSVVVTRPTVGIGMWPIIPMQMTAHVQKQAIISIMLLQTKVVLYISIFIYEASF
jgi:hypothetical protein